MSTPVFYSFHFDNDVFRVQQVRNIGVIEGNEPVAPNTWESIKRQGDAAIEKWIDENMKNRRCVIVLIGSETASRKWVLHEIAKAWNEKRGLFGIFIQNLKCPRAGTCQKGANPFDYVSLDGGKGDKLSTFVNVYEPTPWDAYDDIAKNMETWVSTAIAQRR